MSTKEKGKIILLAGNMHQVQYWIRHKIIPVISKRDMDRLQGIHIDEIYKEGTYHRWFDNQCKALLNAHMNRNRG